MTSSKVIAVAPTEKYFSLTWRLGIRCNYDCMYCSSAWHNNTDTFRGLEELQQAWIEIFEKTKVHNLPYKISFTGGELTANKNFLPFVTWLRENYNQHLFKVLASTNGSASLTYYNKMFQSIDNITFSVHSEHINEQKFFNMIVKLQSTLPADKFLHVAVMNEHWNQDRIKLYTSLLNQHQISYSINEIDYSHQTREAPFFVGELNLEV
jgi:MoaA/NifB/PqqE/SkfB family radical SAM enzyme